MTAGQALPGELLEGAAIDLLMGPGGVPPVPAESALTDSGLATGTPTPDAPPQEGPEMRELANLLQDWGPEGCQEQVSWSDADDPAAPKGRNIAIQDLETLEEINQVETFDQSEFPGGIPESEHGNKP